MIKAKSGQIFSTKPLRRPSALLFLLFFLHFFSFNGSWWHTICWSLFLCDRCWCFSWPIWVIIWCIITQLRALVRSFICCHSRGYSFSCFEFSFRQKLGALWLQLHLLFVLVEKVASVGVSDQHIIVHKACIVCLTWSEFDCILLDIIKVSHWPVLAEGRIWPAIKRAKRLCFWIQKSIMNRLFLIIWCLISHWCIVLWVSSISINGLNSSRCAWFERSGTANFMNTVLIWTYIWCVLMSVLVVVNERACSQSLLSRASYQLSICDDVVSSAHQ